jgi:hypothetical protein
VSRGILAKDDLASCAIDLTHLARAITFMPTLLEAKFVDIEPQSTVHVNDEKHGTRVPAVRDYFSNGCLGHVVP